MDKEHMNEIMSKLWDKDFMSLTNEEIHLMIQNMFYQLFLLEVTELNYAVNSSDEGSFAKFIITCDVYTEDTLEVEFKEEDMEE